MKIDISSGNYTIIDSGIVFTLEGDSDITFHLDFGLSSRLNVKLLFEKDVTQEQVIEREVEGNDIKLICRNFNDNGTGTNTPMGLATIQGKTVYFKFWAYLEGDTIEKNGSRKIEYTFFMGK